MPKDNKTRAKRRQRRHRRAQLASLGRDAENKLISMSARVDSSNETIEQLSSEQGKLRQQAGRVSEDNAHLRQEIEQLLQERDRLQSQLDGQSSDLDFKSSRIESLEENLRSLLKSIEEDKINQDHKDKARATLMVRQMQPCFRKRMLAKNDEIDRLKRAFQLANSMRNPREEASIAKAIKTRDQIIIGMYSALQWCEQRPEFKEGQGKSDWDAKIGPLMSRLGNLIRGESGRATTGQQTEAPTPPEQTEHATEASAG